MGSTLDDEMVLCDLLRLVTYEGGEKNKLQDVLSIVRSFP